MTRLRSFLAFSLVVALSSSYLPSLATAARPLPLPKGADLGVTVNAPATVRPGESGIPVIVRFTNGGPNDVQKAQAYAIAADGISLSVNSSLPNECKLFGKSYVLCNFQNMPTKGILRELSLLASVTGNADCRNPSAFRGSISGGINAIGIGDPNPKNNLHRVQPKLKCVPVCGNGVAEIGEECDDGNKNDADVCTNACKAAVCGDSIVQPVIGEQCDDGNSTPNDGCTKCLADFCEDSDATAEFPGGIGNFGTKGTMKGTGGGGGIYTGTDSCIDANKLMEYGCIGTKTNVTNTTCDNGCKDGACIQSVCGNGTVETGEQCDDGNTVNGDGCSNECRIEEQISLQGAVIDGGKIEISYSKNFSTCAHIYVRNDNKFSQKINFICGQGENLTATADMKQFSRFLTAGEEIKICHGNNGNFCSGYVSVKGSNKNALKVSLNANGPHGDTVPKGSTVNMLSADFTASCDKNVIVDGLTLVREGVGDEGDLASVFLAVGGERVSRTRVFDPEDQTADMRFSQPLFVEACKMVTVDVFGVFRHDAPTGGEHNFIIELPSDVLTDSQTVTGSFPIRGERFRVGSIATGTVRVAYKPLPVSTRPAGTQDVVIGKFEFALDAAEDQTFYKAMFENAGTALDGHIRDVFIRRADGTKLTGAAAQTVADYVTLVFDPPFTVLEGDKVTFEVVANLSPKATGTVQMAFEEPTDVFAVGSIYGYGVNGQMYGSAVLLPSQAASVFTINDVIAGSSRLTVGIDGPATQNHAPNATDVVLANIDFTAEGDDIFVNDMYAMIAGQTAGGQGFCVREPNAFTLDHEVEDYIKDVEIRNIVTGQTVDGISVSGGCGGVYAHVEYRFDDFILRGGSRWELRADFTGLPQNGDKFKAALCTADENDVTGCDFGGVIPANVFYNFDAEELSTGGRVTDIRPGEDVNGNWQAVAISTLSVIERALPNDTVVSNSQDVALFRFEATAGKAEDVFVTKFVLKADEGALSNANDYTLWVDTDDDGTVDTILESGRSGQNSRVTFSSFVGGGYTIPFEETVLFEVHADIAGTVVSPMLAIGFADDAAVSNPPFIAAEEADDGANLTGICVDKVRGVCSGNQISLTTTTSAVFTIVSTGNLYITQSPVPTKSRQLLGGQLGESVLDLRLRAENEPIDVTLLAFVQGGPMESIEQLKLFRSGEVTPFASATRGACGAGYGYNVLCARMFSQQLVVPEGDTVNVLVRPQMKSDAQGAINGQNVQLQLIDLIGNDDVLARGFASSRNLAANDNDSAAEGEIFIGANAPAPNAPIVGSNNDVVLAKIAVIENVNPDADGTLVPTGTNKRIARFRFTAALNNNTNNGRNKATLDGVVFAVTSANVDFDTATFDLLNVNDQTQEISCTWASASAETLLVECLRLNNTNVDLQMDSGESITLELQADIVNNRVNAVQGSSLQVSLTDFASRSLTAFGTGVGGSHVRWSDTLGEQSEAFFHWIEYPESMIRSTTYRM